jgi:ribosome-associated protein
MDIRKLQRAIVDGLEDVKAQNIVVFNTEHLSPLFERVIIASGTSNRQTKALAASVRDAVKTRGMQVMRTEGEDNGEWIIVDCGAAVAHIMQPAIRDYYHLEEIWGGKPVKLKLEGEARSLPKASEPEEDEEEAAPAKKGAAKKSAKTAATGKTPAAKKAAGAKAGARAAPKAASKAPAKAPAKKAVTRTVGTKSTAAGGRPTAARGSATAEPVKKVVVGAKSAAKTATKKAPARTPTAKSAPVKQAAPRKTPPKTAPRAAAKAAAKAPARKAPAKKAASRG